MFVGSSSAAYSLAKCRSAGVAASAMGRRRCLLPARPPLPRHRRAASTNLVSSSKSATTTAGNLLSNNSNSPRRTVLAGAAGGGMILVSLGVVVVAASSSSSTRPSLLNNNKTTTNEVSPSTDAADADGVFVLSTSCAAKNNNEKEKKEPELLAEKKDEEELAAKKDEEHTITKKAEEETTENVPCQDSHETEEENTQQPTTTANVLSTSPASQKETTDETTAAAAAGPGKRVVVDLEPELVDSLPVLSLDEVRNCKSSRNATSTSRLLVTYEGIVYDVTQFIHDHPGGRDLLLTAVGLDLHHFFANYTVHGQSGKAATWLAPLAVGKLSAADAVRARQATTPAAHVKRRLQILRGKRFRILLVASTLPFWMTVRSLIRMVGSLVPPLGRLLAWTVPVSVPGWSPGAQRLQATAPQDADTTKESNNNKAKNKKYKVAIIGGGVAGCGAAWALQRSGRFDVVLYEARSHISGNAKTFDWDFGPYRPRNSKNKNNTVQSCVSVTAWPPVYYKNYTALLETLQVETVHQPLSWFLHSKVPGAVGTLWQADPTVYPGSLRQVLKRDFAIYQGVVNFSAAVTNFFTFRSWAPWRRQDSPSMYDTHQGLGLLNPLTVIPLYSLFRMAGGSDLWWNVVFTPQYTASFLVDELRPFPAVFGPLLEAQIPLQPVAKNSWQGASKRSPQDCNVTTCVTWKDAGKGLRQVFDGLVQGVHVKTDTRVRHVEVLRNGQLRVHDEHDQQQVVDRVIFACPANAVGNIYKARSWLADAIFSTPVYADDHHPATGHMHAVMHSDATVIAEPYRDDCLKRASNYVEVTQNEQDGSIHIENQYNFGVQTPGPGVYDLPLDQKPVMLISHALGPNKSIDPSLVRGTGHHARAHPLYSGWNVAALLSLRLVQGVNGIYYCSNWTTPGNCHDMSFLSGLVVAHAVGAPYPFPTPQYQEAKKDFQRLRDLMGV